MLRQRLITGFSLAAVVLVSFLCPGWVGATIFLVLASAIVALAIREFFALAQPICGPGFPRLTTGYALLCVFASAAGAAGLFPEWLRNGAGEAAGMFAFLLAGFFCVFRQPGDWREALQRLFTSIACVVYLCWTLTFIPRLYYSAGVAMEGRYLVLFAILVTKMADVGAYTAGMLTARRPQGNHKLVPSISPKKSWEGLIGGTVFSAAVAALYVWRWGDTLKLNGVPVMNMGIAVAFGVAASLLGLVGDLAESCLKRAADAKDSGTIPGLGGALDILDSLIVVIPAFYAYVHLCAAAGGV